jgi:hypothetical protein
MGMRHHDPVLRRITAMLSVFIFGCVGVVTLAQPALAGTASLCATDAHVYLIDPTGYPGLFQKSETDPIDGPTYDFSLRACSTISFQLGGNGLTLSSTPFWEVFDQNGAQVQTLTGSPTSGNCVSNQRGFSTSAFRDCSHVPGDVPDRQQR